MKSKESSNKKKIKKIAIKRIRIKSNIKQNELKY